MTLIEDKYHSENLDERTEHWIKATLSNDEYSSDEELEAYFIDGGLTKAEAELWTNRRSFYLNNIVKL